MSAAARCAGAEMRLFLAPEKKEKALEQVVSLDLASASLQECIDAHKLITTVFADAVAATAFKQRARERYVHATYFAE